MVMASTIGFVGLGVMGSAIVQRLLQAGHPVVVHNRTPARAQPLVRLGAIAVSTPAKVAQASVHVFACLLDNAAVESVYLGANGLVGAARPGQVFVEHATFAPATARRIAASVASRGAHFLDAPITGGPEGAAAGTLTAMVGGSPAALSVVAEIMGAYTREILRVGKVGRALELKLVNQLLVSCHIAAAAEAAAMIRQLHLPVEVSERALMSGWASSAMLARVLPRAASDTYTSTGATIGGLIEVQRLVAELATQQDLSLQVFDAARARFALAMAESLGGYDPAALALLHETANPDNVAQK
jgi:3-hydroxyisobutyrate dehydrogenase-like beta-hydroxyacid dehydrogenase